MTPMPNTSPSLPALGEEGEDHHLVPLLSGQPDSDGSDIGAHQHAQSFPIFSQSGRPTADKTTLTTASALASSLQTCLPMTWTYLQPIWLVIRPRMFSPARKRRITPTSWLDGLRGMAAFIVVIYHQNLLVYFFRNKSCQAWKQNDPHLWQLPIFRLVCSGGAMVDVFFVVSGYALSYKPLTLARNKEFTKLHASIVSSLFRRGIRLYLPVVFITFVNAVLVFNELLVLKDTTAQRTFLSQVHCWLNDLITGINPLNLDRYHTDDRVGLRYEPVMWTIPYEYRASIVIFAVLLTLARARPLSRFLVLLSLVLCAIVAGQWDMFLFISGSVCCEVHQYMDRLKPMSAATLPRAEMDEKATDSLRVSTTARNVMSASVVFCLLYAITMPDRHFGVGDISIHGFLSRTMPASWNNLPDTGRFSTCVTAVLLVLFLGQSRLCRRALSSRFPQYLGDISFAIYLIHFSLIKTMGLPLLNAIRSFRGSAAPQTPLDSGLGGWIVLFVYSLIALPTLFWLGDLTERYIDKKSVALARWAETKVLE
ncbi:hypothetical protein PV08_09652 [Exophiala spinifera]|uniref:Acyltransferase 3 domain-containing protein n=1 Tax=Exophiala spinifera TaxID=91928 RepID=A0A0D2B106_9EURO|nr:uncharacterized protein PV08_09652 [Exophiala spinifera]KIW12375.1 hypothetical protein PV08_09652 [Exophiala spinifera]